MQLNLQKYFKNVNSEYRIKKEYFFKAHDLLEHCQYIEEILNIERRYLSEFNIRDGFRTPGVSYGAKNSAHKKGMAVDIADPKCNLQKAILNSLCAQDYIRKQGLWVEHFDYTPTWVHIQTRGGIKHPYSITGSVPIFFKPNRKPIDSKEHKLR